MYLKSAVNFVSAGVSLWAQPTAFPGGDAEAADPDALSRAPFHMCGVCVQFYVGLLGFAFRVLRLSSGSLTPPPVRWQPRSRAGGEADADDPDELHGRGVRGQAHRPLPGGAALHGPGADQDRGHRERDSAHSCCSSYQVITGKMLFFGC